MLILIYYTGSDGFSSASRRYIMRSLVTLFVVIFTLCVISIPKVVNIVKAERKAGSNMESEDCFFKHKRCGQSSAGGGLYAGDWWHTRAIGQGSSQRPLLSNNVGSGYESTGATSASTLCQSSETATATETDMDRDSTTDASTMEGRNTDEEARSVLADSDLDSP